MSTALVKAEIERFLKSSDPEVLCVKGKWGVGKTYAWLQFLREVENSAALGLDYYSYVSLFGLNSLEELRYAIFESTVPAGQIINGPTVGTLRSALVRAGTLGRKAKPLFAPLFNIIGAGDAGEALLRAAFLSVRKQIVCLDDLERAGSSLEVRDVLGLTSMLKEQRECKVVLLVNDEQFQGDDKIEFERLLEKVVDVSLVFDPTAKEAISIAFATETDMNLKLRSKVEKLGITNIRVIKKIERLAKRLIASLSGYREEVIDQAIATVTLGGWCVYQPDNAPSIAFVKEHNGLLASIRADDENIDADEKRLAEKLQNYGYGRSDELDLVILDGVVAGYFNEENLLEAAQIVQHSIEHNGRNNSFSKAWDLYHQSLSIDDDVVLDALCEGLKENIATVSPLNFNSTIIFLRQYGRGEEASELIPLYMAKQEPRGNHLREELHLWGKEEVDDELADAFEKLRNTYFDDRDPKEVLLKLAETDGWNPEDVELLERLSASDFQKILEETQGDHLSRMIKRLLSLGTHEKDTEIEASVMEALEKIASKSPLRKRRVLSYGIKLIEANDDPTHP